MASAVQDFGSMQWDEIGRGLTVMAGALAEITLAVNLMPKNMVSTGVGLIAVASALTILSNVLSSMGNFTWEEIAKGLVTMGGALAELSIALNLMNGTLAGSAALLIASAYLTAKQYAEQAVDAAAKAASSASQASGYASTANSRANAAASSASGAANSASAASTSAANAKSYADSAASSKNASASSASNASASATNAKKSETAAANSASLAQAAYEEILGADVGKFGSQLANEHSVLQPIYDSSGQNICDSSGREIQGRIIFADESEVVSLRQQVSHLDTFIRSVISRLGYVTDHALLDSDYKGL